jgi:VWFA-related protein
MLNGPWKSKKEIPEKKVPRFAAGMLAMGLVFAQNPQLPPPDTVIRINVNLVQVDAVVTDSKGKPVPDLKAADFEILQDGKVQVITNFSYISTKPPERIAAPAAVPKEGTPPPPPARLKSGDVRRTVALVVDDLGLSFASTAYVRDALKKFVDQQMQPGDLVAIIRTSAGMGALQQFTSDKRLLYAAIERVKYSSRGRVGISSFAPLGQEEGGTLDGPGPSIVDDLRNQIFSVGTLGATRYVVDGLLELPGRKSIVLFSEGMNLFNRRNLNDSVVEDLRRLVDAANRASVVIYSIDPRGLQWYGLTAADSISGMNPLEIAAVSSQRSAEMFHSQDGLVMLARDTGGLFIHNTNDIAGAVREVMSDTEGYYLIGYHPDASTFDLRTGQPKFHKVALRLKRPGLTVRTRTGFYGSPERQRPAVAHTREAELAYALTSPFGAGAIHVRLSTLFSNSAKSGSFVTSMLHIDARDLKFSDEPDGWHKAVVDVLAVTFGDSGQAVDTTGRSFTIRAKADMYQLALKNGLLYSVCHPVKKPGAYQMRVALRDAASEQVGSASQFIEVPDVNKGRLTLSSVVLREQPKSPGGPNPEALAADGQEGEVADENPEGGPAIRIFKPGSDIIYGYQVMNARADSTKPAELEEQVRLFRDGKQVYEGKVDPLKLTGQPDPKRLLVGGSLKVGGQVPPGDYVLQVIVTDRLAKEKYRTATQWMDFEVR